MCKQQSRRSPKHTCFWGPLSNICCCENVNFASKQNETAFDHSILPKSTKNPTFLSDVCPRSLNIEKPSNPHVFLDCSGLTISCPAVRLALIGHLWSSALGGIKSLLYLQLKKLEGDFLHKKVTSTIQGSFQAAES